MLCFNHTLVWSNSLTNRNFSFPYNRFEKLRTYCLSNRYVQVLGTKPAYYHFSLLNTLSITIDLLKII